MPRGVYKRKPIIKVGDRFNELTAIKFSHKNKYKCKYWLFKCSCGKEKVINVDKVKGGYTKSCGCLKGGIVIHGMSKSSIHNIWTSMKNRCLNKNVLNYKNYGGRGITICNRWLSFQNFFNDMGDKPNGLSLDRINNDKGYSKENCRWTTIKKQNNNRRTNVFLTYKNKTQTIKQWSEELKIKYSIFWYRINKNYDKEELKLAMEGKEMKVNFINFLKMKE